MEKNPIRVAVTGGAGQIAYSLLFRLASGEVFGPDQPVILQIIEVPEAMGFLAGVKMELDDCAFPLVQDIILTDDPAVGFKDANWAILVGGKPRTKDMERSDLLSSNGAIFATQGGRSTTTRPGTFGCRWWRTRATPMPWSPTSTRRTSPPTVGSP